MEVSHQTTNRNKTFKGVMHVHSTHSYDGKVPLAELKTLLMKAGISFACMTEHTDDFTEEKSTAFIEECRLLSDDSFLFIPGFEVPYKDAHILMIGLRHFISQIADAEKLATWASGASFVVLAHPVRNKFIVDDVLLSAIDGIEIWNQQYDGKLVPRTRSCELLINLRKRGKTLLATGGLDLHRREHMDAPTIEVSCEVFSEENILTALKKGSYIFGNSEIVISALGSLADSQKLSRRLRSVVSTTIILYGKRVNAVLHEWGMSPKRLIRMIRSKI